VSVGESVAFTTQVAGGGFVIAGGGSWELVSPPDKHGAIIEALTAPALVQSAVSGDAMSFLATGPTEAGSVGNANDVQVLSTRSAGGWVAHDVAVPHEGATGASTGGSEYRFFSGDLSLAVVQPFGHFVSGLSSEASERTAFLRRNFTPGDPGARCVVGCFRPLVTGKAGFANVPAGAHFGEEGTCLVTCGPKFVGASPDLGHVLLVSGVGLSEGSVRGLYEWSAATGGLAFISPEDVAEKFHFVSGDGSRVVFTENVEGHERLLLRDVGRGQTVTLDAAQQGVVVEGAPQAHYQGASSDGSRVFFTDTQRLTGGSGASGSSADLYMCEIVVEGGVVKCNLSDVTPLMGSVRAGVVGEILGVSGDGSWVYYAANGALAAGAVAGGCQPEINLPGVECNVYVSHFAGGVWGAPRLVGVVSGADNPDWGVSRRHTARVSGNGEWLAFDSMMGLTGFDNRDVVSGVRDEEVFLYHASDGGLRCVSCVPTGAAPRGSVAAGQLFNGDRIWEPGRAVAGVVPDAWTQYALRFSLYQSRSLSDSGRLVFSVSDGLVPLDVNETWDVYRFTPEGVGGVGAVCGPGSDSGSVVYLPARAFVGGVQPAGCVGLVSPGDSPEESVFLDASEGGGDVFFLTAAKLAAADFDTSMDVYDAHECGGVAVVSCVAAGVEVPPPCDTGDACKAAPSLQPEVFGAPASSTFVGAGNPPTTPPPLPRVLTRGQRLAKALRACRSHNKHKRQRCEKTARTAYGANAHRSRKAARG
jgi:hypothetical protein